MGMDVYGKNGCYFRANVWSWRAICHAIELAGFEVPGSWGCNDGAGLDGQQDCDELAGLLEAFLKRWDGDILVWECGSSMRLDSQGQFVDAGTPGSKSPYQTDREHLEEFVSFLRSCQGFEIH